MTTRKKQPELRTLIDKLEPGQRTTPQQRRELLICALRRADELASDPTVASSTQAKAVSEIRTIVKQLSDLDAELDAPASQWGADKLGAV